MTTPRRALLSVSDKTGIVALAQGLAAAGFELISTGGTARALQAAGLTVTSVSSLTGHAEVFEGRVKTLHPKVHGGILGRWDAPADRAEAETHGIAPIEVVVVNLYPFAAAAARPGAEPAAVIEEIDIGGPALLRAAAKNHAHTWVLVDAADHDAALAALTGPEPTAARALRRTLAAKAFAHTASYDRTIADWFEREGVDAAPLPPTLRLEAPRVEVLRYGENPHQIAALYRLPVEAGRPDLGRAEQLGGKALSFNNLVDLDAALGAVLDLAGPAAVVVKHANPCGAAEAQGDDPLATVYARARATDPVSAFGGIVALNRTVDGATAALLAETFLEAVIAPDFNDEARALLASKRNLRVLRLDPWPTINADAPAVRSIAGGLLVQSADALAPWWSAPDTLLAPARIATVRAPSAVELRDLDFAWRVARHVKSNAIVCARAGQVLGIGAGQMSRVDSSRIATEKARIAGHDLAGCAVSSDAFFPFADGVEAAAAAGATAVIQPGGSVRDAEVIAAADALGLAMILTGRRHFRHG